MSASSPKVGQAVQYFNTKGEGPFAATILGTSESYDPAKAAFDKRVPQATEVTLQVTALSGRSHVREYVPMAGTPEHGQAIAWEQAHAPKNPETGEPVEVTSARCWKPLA